MAEIVNLRGTRVTDGQAPDPDVVKLLEDMAALAREGQIIGVALAVNYHDRQTYAQAEGTCSWATIGRLQYLVNRAIEALK